MMINTLAKLSILVCLVSLCCAAPAGVQNILFGSNPALAATIVGNQLQLLPLKINDPNQQWTFDAEGYIINVARPDLVFDVSDNSEVGGTRVIAYQKKTATSVPPNTNQLWNVYPDGTIESRLVPGYFLGPDTDGNTNFLEVDYNTPATPFVVTPPVPYVCSSTGDPHINRFPGECPKKLEAQEKGTFALALFGGTRVSVTHTQCGANPAIYCNTKAVVQVNGVRIQIDGDTVLVNNQVKEIGSTPYPAGAGFNITRLGPNNFIVYAPNGNIQIQGNPYTNAAGESLTYQNIIVTGTSGLVPDGGLCQCKPGQTDTTTTSRKRDLTPPQFVHSWKYRTICEDPFYYASVEDYNTANPPESPTSNGNWTTNDPVLQATALLVCAPLLSGPLVTACSPFLDPAPWYQSCLDDVIASEVPEFAALNIDGYAAHCSGLTTVVLPTSGARSIAYGPGLGSPYAGAATTFTIRARDVNGKNRTTGGDSFDITATGPGAITFTKVDNNDGTYTITYTPTVAGNYNISIKFRGVDHIQSSKFAVTVLPAIVTSSLHSTASGPGLEQFIFAGDTYQFTVQAKTAAGVNRVTGGDTVTVVITGTAFVTVVDNHDGTYTVTYEQDQITTFTITVRINGGLIAGSPFNVEAW